MNQAVKVADGWHERAVGIAEDGRLAFVVASEPIPHFAQTLPAAVRAAADGAIFEWRADTVAMEVGRRVAREPGAALVIDYGHSRERDGRHPAGGRPATPIPIRCSRPASST